MNTVIIDDDPVARAFLKEQLRVHAPQVKVVGIAGDFDTALLLLSTLRPDVIFMDITPCAALIYIVNIILVAVV